MGETQVLDDDRSGAAARTAGEAVPRTPAAGARLASAVARLEAELAAYRSRLPDRAVAEDELGALRRLALAAEASHSLIDTERVRRSLLLVVAALGSVSALAEPLAAVRDAVEVLVPLE